VNEKLCPLLNVAELKVADLIWCGIGSLFVQVTIVPTLIVRGVGLNAKFFIDTDAVKFTGWVGGLIVAGGVFIGGVFMLGVTLVF
jgi:hypothetical protein